MAEKQKNLDDLHSVKISINAKGKFSAEVKTYAKTPEEALKQTTAIAKELETLIADKNQEGN